jgi:hypothetical protein
MDDFLDEYVAVHGIFFSGPPWEEMGISFVLLPKNGGFDGEDYNRLKMTIDEQDFLEVCEPTLAQRLRDADGPLLVGGASYNLDGVVIGKLKMIDGRKRMTDLLCVILQRGADPSVYIRNSIYVINFQEHTPPLPWHGRTLATEIVPLLQLFPQ